MFRIVIAADDVSARSRLEQLVSREPGLTVVGEADGITATLDMVRDLDADVVLVGLSSDSTGTLDLIADVRRRLPGVLIVAVLEDASQSTVRDAFAAGASAFMRVEHSRGHGSRGWTFVLPEDAVEEEAGVGLSPSYPFRGIDPLAGKARLGRVAAEQDRRAGSTGRGGRSPHGCR